VLTHVEPMSVQPVRPLDADPVVCTEHSMSNPWLAVRWDLDGELISIIDVAAGRELLSSPVEVRLAQDHPVEYDAWDIEAWTVTSGSHLGGVTSSGFVEQHPLRARFEVRRRFGKGSSMVQTYTLCADSRRLDIAFDIDWHEDEHYLSYHLPLDVHTERALCDIQFGHVARPTHTSTSWDAAKFEVCAHRWVALEERGRGAAVLNNGRYGHGVQGGEVRVSLLRAAKFPDPQADLGRHRVTVAVMAFAELSEVIRDAEALNVPLRVLPAGGDGSLVAGPVIDHPGVQVSAVKQADDGSGDWVLRLYEACGARSQVSVRLPRRIVAAERTNLLEDPGEGIDVADGIVALTLRPFELVTLRLRMG
jgi:alpha-mannosidase